MHSKDIDISSIDNQTINRETPRETPKNSKKFKTI